MTTQRKVLMAQQSSPDALQEILPPIGTVAPTKNTRSPRQINDQQRADATARRSTRRRRWSKRRRYRRARHRVSQKPATTIATDTWTRLRRTPA